MLNQYVWVAIPCKPYGLSDQRKVGDVREIRHSPMVCKSVSSILATIQRPLSTSNTITESHFCVHCKLQPSGKQTTMKRKHSQYLGSVTERLCLTVIRSGSPCNSRNGNQSIAVSAPWFLHFAPFLGYIDTSKKLWSQIEMDVFNSPILPCTCSRTRDPSKRNVISSRFWTRILFVKEV